MFFSVFFQLTFNKFCYYFIMHLAYFDFQTSSYIFVFFSFLFFLFTILTASRNIMVNWSMILNFYEFSITIKGKRRMAWNRVRFYVRPCWQPCHQTRLLPNRHSDRMFLSLPQKFNSFYHLSLLFIITIIISNRVISYGN